MDDDNSSAATAAAAASKPSTSNNENNAQEQRSNGEGSSSSSSQSNGGGSAPETNFDCNICLDTAKDAVVSVCGHLFCWPCLHQWFETKPVRPTCPVCKNPISRDQVIPLYGRGSSKKDPREKKIPPRPQGQRSEQDYSSMGFPNFGFGDGFHMSFGIGAVPFGFFASTFNIGDFRTGPMMMDGMELAQDQFVSKIFMWLAIVFIVWLLFA